MFRVFDQLVVDWEIRVDVGDGKGRHLAPGVTFTFEILPNDEFMRLSAQGGMPEVMRRAVRGWRSDQIADETGEPLAYSKENLERLMLVPRMQAAITQAYIDAATGTRRKNFEPPRDGG